MDIVTEVVSENTVRYNEWLKSTKRADALTLATINTYASDVASWIASLNGRSLEKVNANRIAAYLQTIKLSRRRRVLSAISDFWAYAMTRKWVRIDEPRLLKFRRSKLAVSAQLDLFDLLLADGLTEKNVLGLHWKDFVAPVIALERKTIRVGQRSLPIPSAWARLEMEFRSLASRENLENLVAKKIVPIDSPRRAA